jgi:CBS domain containing-hemolysin-like protein
MRKQRLESLRNLDRDAHAAYLWLQDNMNKFEKKVYGPVLIELNVPNALHAKYMEHVVPKWLMTVLKKWELANFSGICYTVTEG